MKGLMNIPPVKRATRYRHEKIVAFGNRQIPSILSESKNGNKMFSLRRLRTQLKLSSFDYGTYVNNFCEFFFKKLKCHFIEGNNTIH